MKNIIIFYFSGTGNAKSIAEWIKEFSDQKNINCVLYNIAGQKTTPLPEFSDDTLLILISPIHGFNYPKITLDFIRSFPKGKNDIILMNTRAGMKIKNWVTPGLTGVAFYLASLLLKIKGYNIKGHIPYDMPSNWISLHPALNLNTIKYIHKTIYSRVYNHFNRILQGEKLFLSKKEIIQDLLISPVSILYYFVGRFIIAKTFFANHKCDNCGFCIKGCPVSAIKEINNKPFWTVHCESCMKCMNYCPKQAIETAHGLIVFTAVIYSLLIETLYLLIFKKTSTFEPLDFVAANIVFFSLILISYRIQHYLLKIKFFARVISFASLTYYKFWGRYKSIKNNIWQNETM